MAGRRREKKGRKRTRKKREGERERRSGVEGRDKDQRECRREWFEWAREERRFGRVRGGEE